jgi:hypothetical protein
MRWSVSVACPLCRRCTSLVTAHLTGSSPLCADPEEPPHIGAAHGTSQAVPRPPELPLAGAASSPRTPLGVLDYQRRSVLISSPRRLPNALHNVQVKPRIDVDSLISHHHYVAILPWVSRPLYVAASFKCEVVCIALPGVIVVTPWTFPWRRDHRLVTGEMLQPSARPLCQVSLGWSGLPWPCELGCTLSFGPLRNFKFQFFIHFQKWFKSSSNIQNSYQFQYCYKIHETNSVGFLISSSTHEKYKTK